MKTRTRNLLVGYLILTFLMLRCKEKDKDKEEVPIATNYLFPVGVAVNINEFNSDLTYKTIVSNEFNSITAENVFKAENLHPTQVDFYWSEADALMNYCLQNNKRMHGHTLIWHNQLPIWMVEFTGTKEDWEEMFKQHIQTIVAHFKGKVASWDVVNEAFNEDGTLRNTIWKEHIGEDYIEKAFVYAKQSDPDALLFYNDYNLESNTTKRNAVLSYFNQLRGKGITIDGIGLQMHVGILYPSPAQIQEAISVVVLSDYKLHLSELDISVNQQGLDIEPNAQLFVEQAQYLEKIIQEYKKVPKQMQHGITVWGVSDKHTWIRTFFNREDYPLLFDDNYQKKPAYFKLNELLHE